MKLQIPQNSDQNLMMIEITGPDFLKIIEVSTEHLVIERNYPDVDERLLTAKAWFISNAREPVGEEFVLKAAEVIKGLDEDLDEDLDEMKDLEDKDDEEAPVEDHEEAAVEEADDLVEEPADE